MKSVRSVIRFVRAPRLISFSCVPWTRSAISSAVLPPDSIGFQPIFLSPSWIVSVVQFCGYFGYQFVDGLGLAAFPLPLFAAGTRDCHLATFLRLCGLALRIGFAEDVADCKFGGLLEDVLRLHVHLRGLVCLRE